MNIDNDQYRHYYEKIVVQPNEQFKEHFDEHNNELYDGHCRRFNEHVLSAFQ